MPGEGFLCWTCYLSPQSWLPRREVGAASPLHAERLQHSKMPHTKGLCDFSGFEGPKIANTYQATTMSVSVHGPAGARPSKVNDQEWMGILQHVRSHLSDMQRTRYRSVPEKDIDAVNGTLRTLLNSCTHLILDLS